MGNPYQPTVIASRFDAPKPTLDLNTETGPEREQELPGADVAGNTVPEGTIKEIVTWVGEDKDRAKAATDAEQKADEPRKTLLNKLKEVLEA